MSYNYGPLAAKSVKLIAKYGAEVDLHFLAGDVLDPDKPWRGPDQTHNATRSIKGLVTTFERDEIDGELVKRTDVKLLVAAQDAGLAGLDIATATQASVIKDGGAKVYGCSNLTPVAPGDTTIIYTLRLRLD